MVVRNKDLIRESKRESHVYEYASGGRQTSGYTIYLFETVYSLDIKDLIIIILNNQNNNNNDNKIFFALSQMKNAIWKNHICRCIRNID